MSNLREDAGNLGNAIIAAERHGHAAVVLVATTILEKELERCLLTQMFIISQSFRDRLFSGYGPLATFAAKIDICYALKIIDKSTFDELLKLKTIRNKLAHSQAIQSLDQEPLLTLFDRLSRPDGSKGTYIEVFLDCVGEINDRLEVFLVANGVTDDISEKRRPK